MRKPLNLLINIRFNAALSSQTEIIMSLVLVYLIKVLMTLTMFLQVNLLAILNGSLDCPRKIKRNCQPS